MEQLNKDQLDKMPLEDQIKYIKIDKSPDINQTTTSTATKTKDAKI